MADSIFRKETLKKVSSPEELHDYIRIASPGVWLVIAAAAALLVGLLVWSAFATVDSTVTAPGVASGGVVRCYLADVTGVQAGETVTIGAAQGTVRTVSEAPLAREAAAEDCGADDYTIYRLGLDEWNYVVVLDVPDAPDGFVQASIVTEQVRPLNFISA